MKKKLVALAIAGMSGAAIAQSSVVITGVFDVGYLNSTTQTTAAGKDTQSMFAGSNSATSTLIFKGTEDLGGGLAAGFVLESNFTPAANQLTGVTAGSVPSVTNAPFVNSFLNGENYVMLSSKDLGTLKLGNVNNTGLEVAYINMQPLGTQMGSGYSGVFARLNGVGTNGFQFNNNATSQNGTTANGGARLIRISHSAKYDSPVFNGLQVTYQHSLKNDNDQYSSFGYSELGAKYDNGPLKLGFSTVKLDSGANLVGVASNAGAIARNVTKHNLLGGNYNFGPAILYAGWTSSKQTAGAAGLTTADANSWNLAFKWFATPSLAVTGNWVSVDDKTAANVDRKLAGLGLDYSLSKRTVIYGRYEGGDHNKANATTGDFSRFATGLRHLF